MINNKLSKIEELIKDGSFILDIGCDHALLDVSLMLNKKNIKCIASDKREKPLLKAKENIEKLNLQDKITLRICDGIGNISDDITDIVISGMGGILIKDIILKDKEKIKKQRIITCPNNDSDILRYNMYKNGFVIEEEYLVEDKYIYEIITFRKTNKKERITNIEIKYGKYFEKDELYYKYFNNKRQTMINILHKLPNKYILKKLKISMEIKSLDKILKH